MRTVALDQRKNAVDPQNWRADRDVEQTRVARPGNLRGELVLKASEGDTRVGEHAEHRSVGHLLRGDALREPAGKPRLGHQQRLTGPALAPYREHVQRIPGQPAFSAMLNGAVRKPNSNTSTSDSNWIWCISSS